MKLLAFLAGAIVSAPFIVGQAVAPRSEKHGLVAVESGSDFVGSETCRGCHASKHADWTQGRHSKMLQPASPATVIPPFDKAVTLHDKEYRLQREGNAYFIEESYLQATPTKRRVDYTLGSRRVQHYLSRTEDGRIIVLPPSYDVERKEWFHNLDIVDLEESGSIKAQVWNSNCFGCHASGEKKGFDPATKTYQTTWTDFGTGCERCHGPGGAHVAKYAMKGAAGQGDPLIVHPARLDAETSISVCAQCHALRDITQPGFTSGSNYYDSFTPLLEYAQKQNHDPAYWPNGRPRRFSNEAMAFWESQCSFKGGATCLTCHSDAHEPNIEKNTKVASKQDSLCVGCHQKIASEGAKHTHHGETAGGREGTSGSSVSCVSCHMPRTVISLRHRMPDHTISIPAPENTTRFAIPNACNECHKDQSAAWSESKLATWFPGGRRHQTVDDAVAFTLAVKKDPAAIPGLVKIAGDVSRPPLFRANALGHLRNFDDPAATSALLAAAKDEHPAVRVAAYLSLTDQAKNPLVARVMEDGLADPRRTVRMAAALGVLNSGRRPPSVHDRPVALTRAMDDHARRAGFLNEDAAAQLDLGKMFFLAGDFKKAETSVRDALRLSPRIPGGQYFLGMATLGQNRMEEGTAILRGLDRNDPYRKDADALLSRLSGS
ncbi:MAG: HEAT repeat domain-containing protein [Vicinamibacteria bacterium]